MSNSRFLAAFLSGAAPGDVTIEIPQGTLALTTAAPGRTEVIIVPLGSLVLSTAAPGVASPASNVEPPAGALSLSGTIAALEGFGTDLAVAKQTAYAVLGEPADAAVAAKVNTYAVLQEPLGRAVAAKVNTYAVLSEPLGQAVVSKFNVYVVLRPPSGRKRRQLWISG